MADSTWFSLGCMVCMTVIVCYYRDNICAYFKEPNGESEHKRLRQEIDELKRELEELKKKQ